MKIIPKTEDTASLLAELATACGNALACAHARGGDPMAISSYRGNGAKFAAAIGQFAKAYADQSVRDHARGRAGGNARREKVSNQAWFAVRRRAVP